MPPPHREMLIQSIRGRTDRRRLRTAAPSARANYSGSLFASPCRSMASAVTSSEMLVSVASSAVG